MSDSIAEYVRPLLADLDLWVQSKELKGFDPYDLRGIRPYLWAMDSARGRSLPAKLLRGGFSVLEDTCPMVTRRFLGVKPRLNAKAMGLFAKAYLNLYRLGLGPDMLNKAMYCLSWLEANPSPGYAGLCWGYPFNWQSTVFIPEGTPSSVVSWTVADAFWTAYQVTGEFRFLEVCCSVCRFFQADLFRDEPTPGQACYSYTPIDRMHVLNATLFVGEFLVRVGTQIDNKPWVKDGLAVVEYLLTSQMGDGSWPYYGQADHKPVSVDHYHTGFIIRMLKSVASITKDQKHLQAVDRGFQFYWSQLFEPQGLPKFMPNRTYPINIHSIAEALLCMKAFEGADYPTRERAHWLIQWAFVEMRDPEGFWYFMKYPGRTVKIPFMRWGQAWMFLAMSEVASLNDQNGGA